METLEEAPLANSVNVRCCLTTPPVTIQVWHRLCYCNRAVTIQVWYRLYYRAVTDSVVSSVLRRHSLYTVIGVLEVYIARTTSYLENTNFMKVPILGSINKLKLKLISRSMCLCGSGLSPCLLPNVSSANESHEDIDHGREFISPPSGRQTPPRSPLKLAAVRRRARTTSTSFTSEADGPVVRSGKQAIFTAGRPPWYNSQGQLKEAFVIGICGGSASGKTTVARRIIEALNVQWVSLVSMDSFYKTLNEEQHETASRNEYNFDCPDAFDLDLIVHTVRRLKEGKSVDIPVYNFATHRVENYKKTIYGANVVIFEGILAFEKKELRDLMDMKVFVDTDSDIRLARRLRRDITERGREIDGVIKQYHKFVKPAYDHHIEPSRIHADVIVPRGGENVVAINLIVIHVHQKLHERGFRMRSQLKQAAHEGQPLPHTLNTLEKTNQVIGLHTFIRNKETARDEFIFYSKRLMRLLIEYALSLLPFKTVVVDTPQGVPYEGKRMDTGKICGVSILRAGETMEPALCDVCKDVSLGKILIQTNLDTGEPELHYLRLPKDIKDHYVMLMDATMATGAAAMMAIRVLLDHDVPQENILLLSLIMAVSGVHAVAYAFPKVRLVTTEVDPEINDHFYIIPGIGNFGDRYFGTEPAVVDDLPVFP